MFNIGFEKIASDIIDMEQHSPGHYKAKKSKHFRISPKAMLIGGGLIGAGYLANKLRKRKHTKTASKDSALSDKLKQWIEYNQRKLKPLPPGKPKIIKPGLIRKLSSEMSMKPKKGETKLHKKLREQAEITSLGC